MPEVTSKLVEKITCMLANAVKSTLGTAATTATADGTNSNTQGGLLKLPTFYCKEFRSLEDLTVKEFFKRFELSLQLSMIPAEQHANYTRVFMGSELKSALKILVNPRTIEESTYTEIRTCLIEHFDSIKIKYTESIKF